MADLGLLYCDVDRVVTPVVGIALLPFPVFPDAPPVPAPPPGPPPDPGFEDPAQDLKDSEDFLKVDLEGEFEFPEEVEFCRGAEPPLALLLLPLLLLLLLGVLF